MPGSGKCFVLVPALLVLVAGLLYTGRAFRIREHTGSDVCHSTTGRCSSPASSSATLSPWASTASLRAKRGFETVSARGSFAKNKQQPPDEPSAEEYHVSLKKKDKKPATRPWSKLSKIEDVTLEDVSGDETDEDKSDGDDEVEIEVEDEDEVVIESEEYDEKENLIREEEERRKRDEAEKERKRLAREEEERKKKEREEQERLRKEEEQRKKREKEEQEKRRKEEEERKREVERMRKEEEERKRKEKEQEERRKREAAEKRLKEEAERRLREEEEKRVREEEERRQKQEEERRKKEEEERRLKEEEERRLKEEEERRLREEEERRLKEEEERRIREEEQRLKEEEEQRLREEEERRLKEEEERRKKEEEERKKREEEKKAAEKKKKEEERKRKELEEKEAERKRKEKEEKERKRKQLEEEEAERIRDAEEDRKRVERVKREAEEKKLRDEEERRRRSKPKTASDEENDEEEDESEDGDDDDDDDDDGTKLKKKLEKVRLADKEKAKSKQSPAKQTKDSSKTTSKSKSGTPKAEDSKPKSSKKSADETEAAKPRTKSAGQEAHLSLAELNDMILSAPTFVPNFTAVEDPACQQHGKIFLRQLRGYKLWALQMLDSSAKIPAGLLRGNVNQLGDFDQCLGIAARVKVEEKTVKVQGKYCLANMDLYATQQAAKLPVNLMQSRALIRGNMRDPGHFVPRFTTVNWALCLPAACSAEDARRSIENALEIYNLTAGIKFVVDVDPDMCYVHQKSQSYSKETIGVLYFYAIFVCLAIVATLRDYFSTLQEKGNYSERIIMAFSLKRTLKALFENKETSSSDIGCIHGIRTLSTITLYVAHKLIPTSRIPYANRVSLTEIANHPLSSILRTSLFFTDSFLLLSGVLTAFHMAKELSTRGEIRWFCRFVARFMRLTPPLLAVVFWYAFVMEHTGSGPQWNAVVKTNADICKENAWINLLYVQNFIPFEEMCATHTHQLALDMQLSLAAPALVFFLQIKPILGVIVVFFLLQVSATLRYLSTTSNNLSLVIFHGMTLKHLYKTANLTYALTLHRATPYLFGVTVGVLLHYLGKNIRIHKIFNIIGWLAAIALGTWSLFSPWRLAKRDYVYDVEDATHYAVISPIATALSLSWIIFACFTNNGGIINKFLSSYWMKVFSRLSYAIYLSQFAVFFYNVGSARYSSEFQPYKIIDPFEVVTVVAVSIVLTLLFDIPMQEVKNIIMELGNTAVVEEIKEDVPEENHKDAKTSSADITPEEEEEPTPGGWNWNRGTFTKVGKPEPREYDENGIDEYRSSRLKRQDIRRQSMIRSEDYDEWDGRGSRRTSRSEEHSMENGRTNRTDYRNSNAGLEDEDGYLHPRERYYSGGYTRSPMRDLDAPVVRRSMSRERLLSQERESRDYSKKPLITISKEEDYQRSPRSSMPRFTEQQRSLSSESDLDLSSRRNSTNFGRRSAEPRISDEDDWEDELRLRRNRYLQQRVSSQERDRVPPPLAEEETPPEDDEWDSLKRRSSAEGKMALLKEPLRPGNMELWTVSKMQLGSSQEPDDEEFEDDVYLHQRREYREQAPPLREDFRGERNAEEEEDVNQTKSYASESLPTSFEEEDDVTNNEFVLKRDSKSITVQDLSKLPPEDEIPGEMNWNKLDVKSGLFKRESIVKSQASEEDPEYLLPERPKLVEQEQEHPFKKAWQMQKSRSEEEGAIYVVKDSKPIILEKQKEEPEEKPEEKDNREGAQSQDIVAPDVACEVTLVWQPRSNETEDNRSTSKSDGDSSSAGFDWPDEEEQLETRNRRKSQEEYWTWTERDT